MIFQKRKVSRAENDAKALIYKYFNGDIHKINCWYCSPNRALQNKTPVSLIATEPERLWLQVLKELQSRPPL